MADSIRVVVVDDHAILRTGVRALLEAEDDLTVVDEAESGEEGVRKAGELDPDVVLMDISMPGMGGLEAIRRIAGEESGTRVLALTMHAEEEYLFRVLEAGGSGYVPKSRADEDLADAVRTVARGEVFLYPSAQRLLLRRYREGEEGSPEEAALKRLSDREREVLALTAEGFSSTEIGEQLYISPKTVDTYRSRIMRKLGLGHRTELVRFALRTGLLRPGEGSG